MKSSLTTRVLTTTGFVLGAFALAAVAGTWTPPTTTPPGGNVDAPINVGLTEQFKLGPLRVNTNTTNPVAPIGLILGGKIQIVDGNQAAGKVLVSDANGVGSWASSTASGGGGGSGTSPVAYFYWNYDNADKIGDTYNVSTVTRGSDASIVTVTFQTPLTGNAYVVTCNGGTYFGEGAPVWTNAYEKTPTGFKVRGFYVYSRDAGPYTIGSLSCVVYGGTETVVYGTDNGLNKVATFAQGSQFAFDAFGTSGNDINEAMEDATSSATPGGAVSNAITLNTANTYRVTYTYTPTSGEAPNIRFVATSNGRNTATQMTNVTGTGAVGTTDYLAQSGTHSFTFRPSATNGYLEVSIGSAKSTNFSMTDISLTIN